MKKRRLIGLTALLLSLGLSGCLGDGGKTGETEKPEGELSYVGTKDNHYQVDSKGNRVGSPEPHVLVDSEGDKDHVPMPATCTKPGKGFQQCSICKKFIEVVTPALKHHLVEDGESTAKCDEPGTINMKCDREGCDYTETKSSGDKPLGHQWGDVTAVNAKVGKATCGRSSCGMTEYVVDVKTGGLSLVNGTAWKNDPSSGVVKLNSDGDSYTFSFDVPKGFSGKGKMYQRGYMDQYSSNSSKKLYYETSNVCNIEVTVNGAAVAMDSDYIKNLKFEDVYGSETEGTNSTVKDVLIGEVDLATTNTITFKRVKTLNILVSAFVFVGTEA